MPFQGAARKRHFCPLPRHRYPKATDTKVSVKVQTQKGSNEPLTFVIIICEGPGLGDLEKGGVIAPSKHVHFYLCLPQGLLDCYKEKACYKERPLYNHDACRSYFNNKMKGCRIYES